MALTNNQKLRVRKSLHDAYSQQELSIPWKKDEADAAITDADNWIDTNAAAYAAALSQPYRGSSSPSDKSVLLITIAIAQRLVSEPEYLGVLRNILAQLEGIQGA